MITMWIAVLGAGAAAAVSVIATARAYASSRWSPPALEQPGEIEEPTLWIDERLPEQRLSPDTREWVVSTLSQTELFRKLDPEHLERVAASTYVQRFDPGQAIFRQDDPGDRMFVIGEGEVRLVLHPARGGELELTRLARPAFFGEFALLDGRPRTASAITVQPTRLVVLTRQRLFRLLAIEQVVDALLRALVDMVREADRRTAELVPLDLQGTVARRLLELAVRRGGTLVVPDALRPRLAQRLGGPEQLVRGVLSSFQARGYIGVSDDSVEILNAAELRRQAAGRHG